MVEKVRRSIWIDPRILLMLESKGLKLTPIINMVLSAFLDLELDPHEKILKDKTEKIVSDLRENYQKELRYRSTLDEIDEKNNKKIEEKLEKLRKIGNFLQKNEFLRDLKQKQLNNDNQWGSLTETINRENGSDYDVSTLWNDSIEWYNLVYLKEL